MGRNDQKFPKRLNTNCQNAHDKMLFNPDYQGNGYRNNNEILLHTTRNSIYFLKRTYIADVEVEKIDSHCNWECQLTRLFGK